MVAEPPAELFDLNVRPHRINLNTATVTEIEGLRGLGRGTAEAIIANRPYRTVNELTKVNGINMDLVDRLRPALEV
jgi:competence ComEA-like helix-hairpin-helix protein